MVKEKLKVLLSVVEPRPEDRRRGCSSFEDIISFRGIIVPYENFLDLNEPDHRGSDKDPYLSGARGLLLQRR
jgi:hypothetical protein